ncbi:hypothetical protein [Galbibacter pacificus]|uniref:DUF1018 domain-containing protein n=1 Tax=Galbibacter pacificus TaxID=2996052 RepID=A0ABT6FQI9_9FLAO|nr:hypothetical protein [Galbibacter pacificus]MDG3582036.1 hypothetical protein [Galbibacter pacificus]MDG3585490.1 hypothetical protein [Galbibacter pacificus]
MKNREELQQYKVKEIKKMYPDHKYKVGMTKEAYIDKILAPKGLGDTIEKITTATGIKKAVEFVSEKTGIDCGCEERKQKLNQLFPYNKPNCMSEEQLNEWNSTITEIKKTNTITAKQQDTIILLLKEVLNMSISKDNCRTCNGEIWKKYIDMIDKVAAEHKK